jgi:hypothetical protein
VVVEDVVKRIIHPCRDPSAVRILMLDHPESDMSWQGGRAQAEVPILGLPGFVTVDPDRRGLPAASTDMSPSSAR